MRRLRNALFTSSILQNQLAGRSRTLKASQRGKSQDHIVLQYSCILLDASKIPKSHTLFPFELTVIVQAERDPARVSMTDSS